mmetsp:Transcript_40575/g.67982  ORF Transcript_40575/g.67982 Transcript_40575/m.67982 type:complete len:425 (+) Transcript_40575:63-1337(+)
MSWGVEHHGEVPCDAGHADVGTCRFCFLPGSAATRLVSPCACRGTAAYVHITCLQRWAETSSRKEHAWRHCPTCSEVYRGEAAVELAQKMGSLWYSKGSLQKAEPPLRFVYSQLAKSPGVSCPQTLHARDLLAKVLLQQGKQKAVQALFAGLSQPKKTKATHRKSPARFAQRKSTPINEQLNENGGDSRREGEGSGGATGPSSGSTLGSTLRSTGRPSSSITNIAGNSIASWAHSQAEATTAEIMATLDATLEREQRLAVKTLKNLNPIAQVGQTGSLSSSSKAQTLNHGPESRTGRGVHEQERGVPKRESGLHERDALCDQTGRPAEDLNSSRGGHAKAQCHGRKTLVTNTVNNVTVLDQGWDGLHRLVTWTPQASESPSKTRELGRSSSKSRSRSGRGVAQAGMREHLASKVTGAYKDIRRR